MNLKTQKALDDAIQALIPWPLQSAARGPLAALVNAVIEEAKTPD
jgi:hypothetical protein